MKSSLVCSILGTTAILLLVLAFLVYMEAGTAATLFCLAIGVLIAYDTLKSTFRLWKVSKDLIELRDEAKDYRSRRDLKAEEGDTKIGEKESEGIYITSVRYRITKPTRWFAFTMFGMEVFFLFFWPLVSYFAIGNWPVGILYLVFVGVTGVRYYLNAALTLEETGTMDLLDGETELQKWKAQSRFDEIVGNISRGRSKHVWNMILGFFGLIYLALFAGAVGTGQEDASQGFDVPFTYVSPELFRYQQRVDSLRYPSCTLTSDLGDSPLQTMADYAYLAGHAYRGTEASQEELDLYFQGLNVTDRIDLVDTIRAQTVDSTVSFKVITAPGLKNDGDFVYLVIRGTVTPWDAMTDAQLWAPAALMQFLRIILPFGHIWTPVMPYLISAITTMESEAIDQISFYKDTVEFVKWIEGNLPNVGKAITGHSLGGGLSIITGAITQTPAVALSGPNTVLVRSIFWNQYCLVLKPSLNILFATVSSFP